MIDPVGQSAYTTTMPTPATTPDENDGTQDSAINSVPDVLSNGQVETVGTVAEQNGDGGKMKGVLRLLQAGHFHGVADVRLRINFHDEIAAMEHEQYAQTAQQGLTDLRDAIGSQVETVLENPDVEASTATGIGDALAAFDSTLAQHATDGSGDATALTDQIRSDFENLVSSLKTALGVKADNGPDTPTDEITVPEDTPESTPQMAAMATEEPPSAPPAVDYQAFIADLISTFETKLQEFQASLTDINVLPELSQPHGNGKAYDKFVAMYNNLRMPSASETPEPAIDTNA